MSTTKDRLQKAIQSAADGAHAHRKPPPVSDTPSPGTRYAFEAMGMKMHDDGQIQMRDGGVSAEPRKSTKGARR